MAIKVSCPEDSWPNPPTTATFATMEDAKTWAEYGHFCVLSTLHTFEEIEETEETVFSTLEEEVPELRVWEPGEPTSGPFKPKYPPTREDIAEAQAEGRDSRWMKEHPEEF